MKAVILDMYGVILQDPGEGFYSYVNKSFPKLSADEIYAHWSKADIGEIPSLEVFRRLGFQGNLAEIERKYLETVLFNSRNVAYDGKCVESFQELADLLGDL